MQLVKASSALFALAKNGWQRCIFHIKLDTLLLAKWHHSEFGNQNQDKEEKAGSQDVPSINPLKAKEESIMLDFIWGSKL